MAANPWISGPTPSPPPPERTEGSSRPDDATAPAATGPSDRPSSYADRFLAARLEAEPVATEDEVRASAPPAPSTEEAAATTPAPPREPATEAAPAAEPAPAAPPPRPGRDVDRHLLRTLASQRAGTRDNHLGKLSRKRERQAVSNLRELSMVEGNLMGMGADIRTLYFTSCFAGEGKTTAILEAAYGLAVHGSRMTLLVDGNSDNPKLHDEFGLPNRTGLREVLQGKASLQEAIRPTGYESLYVLPCGAAKSALPQEAFADMLGTLGANFDFVLVDGKPLLSSSEVSAVAPHVGGVLLVVECEKTKWEVVQLAQEKLSTAGSKNTGVVLNRRRFYVPRPVYRLMSKR
mgnify:CR=1 FL=1